MEQVCFALPVRVGKADAARAFMRELEGTRKTEYGASERRIAKRDAFQLQRISRRGSTPPRRERGRSRIGGGRAEQKQVE